MSSKGDWEHPKHAIKSPVHQKDVLDIWDILGRALTLDDGGREGVTQSEPADDVGGTYFRVPGRITGNLIGECDAQHAPTLATETYTVLGTIGETAKRSVSLFCITLT